MGPKTYIGFNYLADIRGRSLCKKISRVQWKKNSKSSHKIVLYQQDKASVSKKSLVPYRGKVWCPTTKTGTFVARRKGKVFITGNMMTARVSLDQLKKLVDDKQVLSIEMGQQLRFSEPKIENSYSANISTPL